MDEDSGAVAADLILENGKILTLDDSDRTVEAVAIRNNRFVAVGTASAMQEFAAESTRIVDLGGRTVLPD
jgi:predicted amidohydrolase YtcJ